MDLVATNPARIFGLYPRKGIIALGSDADFCVLDPHEKRLIGERPLHSAADFEPFDLEQRAHARSP